MQPKQGFRQSDSSPHSHPKKRLCRGELSPPRHPGCPANLWQSWNKAKQSRALCSPQPSDPGRLGRLSPTPERRWATNRTPAAAFFRRLSPPSPRRQTVPPSVVSPPPTSHRQKPPPALPAETRAATSPRGAEGKWPLGSAGRAPRTCSFDSRRNSSGGRGRSERAGGGTWAEPDFARSAVGWGIWGEGGCLARQAALAP